MQIQLTPFLEAGVGTFMKDLWVLLLSAQETPSGIPQQFLDEQAEELRSKQERLREVEVRRRTESVALGLAPNLSISPLCST